MAIQLAGVLRDRRYWFLVPLSYLGAIVVAELLTAFVLPCGGMLAHCLLLLALLGHAAWAARSQERALLVCLACAPLMRIVSLWLSFPELSLIHRSLIASLPLFAAFAVARRTLGYSRHALGLELGSLPVQMAVGLGGLVLGVLDYLILRPPPLITLLTWADAWQPLLILLLCTGLLEELIFRGLLLRASANRLGCWGIWYTSLLFATLQIGHRSPAHFAFSFAVGAVWAWIVQRTGSLSGVALAHGLTNVVAYLVMPFVLGP
jgi:uncharacterized protein